MVISRAVKARACCCCSLLALPALITQGSCSSSAAAAVRSATLVSLSARASSSRTAAFVGSTSSSFVRQYQRRMASTEETTSSTDAEHGSTVNVADNLLSVKSRIQQRIEKCNRAENSVRLVAVSKTKPVPMLMEAYEAGQRRFGENYAQELLTKADEMPADCEWHFIGPLQSNKAAPLVKKLGLTKLKCIETVGTMKLAGKLNHAVVNWLQEEEQEQEEEEEKQLGVYIQVNTSGEDTKSGVSPGQDLIDLVTQITNECPNLRVDGLMTIGAPNDTSCFDTLVECREQAAQALGRDVDSLELSMGMSNDFEQAIEKGATSVRVGSTIFGERDYSNKK